MKRLTIISAVLLVSLSLLVSAGKRPTPTDALWKQVGAAQNKGLPQTAIKHLDRILEITQSEGRHGEWLRALSQKIMLEGTVQGNKPEEKVVRLKAEFEKADPRTRPLLRAVLAQWYWHYYNRNRWRFAGRTQTQEMDENDFTTWDLKKIFSEIDGLYQSILQDRELLSKIPVSDFKDFLEPGTMPEEVRPTLYDFIAHEALVFYTSAEQAAAKPEDAFEIDAASDAFGLLTEFLAYQPATEDTGSAKYKAIRLYQSLLAMHLGKNNTEALADLDLLRLQYVKNNGFGEEKNKVYIQRLEEALGRYGQTYAAGMAYYLLAKAWGEEKDLVKAHELAAEGYKRHPRSFGGHSCQAYLTEIENKTLALTGERCVPQKPTKLQVRYKNFSRIYFRAVADGWDRFLNKKWSYPNSIEEKEISALLDKKPAAEWTAELEPTKDYKEKTVEIEVPKLKPGYYRIFASWQPDFKSSTMVQHTWLWVCDYTLVARMGDGNIDVLVVEAESGEPVPGAELTMVYRDNEYYRLGEKLKTDELGRAVFRTAGSYWDRHLLLRHNKQELFDANQVYSYPHSPISPDERTLLYTDRSLYRPGQTIYFKGICVHVDQEGNNYRTLSNRKVTVYFRDANYQEIARQQLNTNDFGSFSGTFTAPEGRLTGLMYVYAEYPLEGSAQFRVEEYKRPKFYVELEKPKTASRLNDSVTVTGTAMGYNGAPVDGAEVRFRVRRVVRWPWWWWWFRPAREERSQEIAHGRIRTDAEGKFRMTFFAKPDLSASKKDDPSFEFTLNADVTAPDGETRSGETAVTLGYKALSLKMQAPEDAEENQSFDLVISSQTLDGQPLSAEGRIIIKKLKEPHHPVPGKLWSYDWWSDRENIEVRKEFGPDWKTWPEDRTVEEVKFSTLRSNPETLRIKLPAGLYKLECLSCDQFGQEVRSPLPLMVLPNWDNRTFSIKIPSLAKLQKASVEVGGRAKVLWGTGYSRGRALVEIEHKRKVVERYWTDANVTQHSFSIPVKEEHRGGLTVKVTQVRENRAYAHSLHLDVPWDNKELEITAETFRDKLQPGQKETWKFRIKGKKQIAAEMAASLYDFSLDQFYPHSWSGFSFFYRDYSVYNSVFANAAQGYSTWRDGWNTYYGYPTISYIHFPSSVVDNLFYYGYARYRGGGPMDSPRRKTASAKDEVALEAAAPPPAPAAMAQSAPGVAGDAASEAKKPEGEKADRDDKAPKAAKPIDTKGFAVRKNLNETAFFFPHLQADKDGSVTISFTMPEALTKWKLLSLAHANDCQSGLYTGFTVTQKELMVQPNAPRFLREGDEIYFTAKVQNVSEKEQKGTVQLNFRDLFSDKPLDDALGHKTTAYQFKIKPKSSEGFSWRIKVPKGQGPIAYTVVAKSQKFSDGEAGAVPILTSRIFLTESVPLWIRGPGEKKFAFGRLKEIGKSETFDPYRLTVQVASNPSWYAVQALPYLIEFPFECSEQVFNRLYANSLAGHIAGSDPKIRKVFDQWKGTDALKSNLEKNQQLKSVMLEETPWVLQAQSESQSKRNVGLLFEENTLKANIGSAYEKLSAMQLSNGAWPWFPGGRPDPYITLYVVTGFARLRHLGAKPDMSMPLKSLDYLDSWIRKIYDDISDKKQNHLSSLIAFYLYGRSFYLKDRAISAHNRVAVDYFLKQAEQYWLDLNSRMSQGYLALALNRFGNKKLAQGILASIKERSVTSEEMGRFWREDELSWWWYQAPIETQALMIEAFAEVAEDTAAVEDCKVWLLKQKQTQHWRTTKATADAVYALLLRGSEWLKSDQLVEVRLADLLVTADRPSTSLSPGVEAGTGFYEKAYQGPEIKPQYSEITVTKRDKGIAWGGVHFQYFEDMSKVTPHKTNLSLEKTLFVNRDTKKGRVIEPVTGPLSVGDLVTCRLVLRVDRDMEYVHLKDLRGSGLESVNVLSQYKYQDGLAYYESTRDAASHFFIDYLPKGTYVFEYQLRVQLKGKYQSGLAEIQCMYAPEFNSHSGSVWMDVK
jgi:uncharacterized protein YfaS (alpha-2-macroglobulin family)